MKKQSLIWLLALVATMSVKADYQVNIPQTLIQPDGTVIQCFASGDEFYNWLHDEHGFTIIQGADGYYYYATEVKGTISPSRHKVGRVDPAKKGLKPHVKISREAYLKKRETKFRKGDGPSRIPNNKGTLQGITIYIRFKDDTILFTQESIQRIQGNFDGSTNSVRSYFQQVSYDQLDIRTTHIPANTGSVITSFEAPHPRNYYRPHDATSNPTGYTGDAQRAQREWTLLRDAINWVRNNHPIANNLNIDTDGDGYADLVNFVVSGDSEGWNSLLWAHQWALQTTGGVNYETVIRGDIKVREYTFLTEQSTSVRTLCHEVFHVLGAPDLYRYHTDDHITPAGRWDLMETGSGHMLARMKMRYGGWIDSTIVPEITTAGTYTLRSHGRHQQSNAIKIPGNGREYFLVEYRRQADDHYEANLPGSGLIVTRINPNMSGSMNYNGETILDEIYVLRPGGIVSQNGNDVSANLSDRVGRTVVSKDHAIAPFYSNGTFANFIIYDVVSFDDSIQFKFRPTMVSDPSYLLGRWHEDSISLYWISNPTEKNIVLIGDTAMITDRLVNGVSYAVGNQLPNGAKVLYAGSDSSFIHEPIIPGKTYYYRLSTRTGALNYSIGIDAKIEAFLDTVVTLDTINNFLPNDLFTLYSYTNNGGFVSGHNRFGHFVFLEHYKNDATRRVSGIRCGNYIAADASSGASASVHVWDVGSDGLPGKELYLEEIPYTSFMEGRWNARYLEWTTLYFQNPPVVQSDFFIGFSISYRTPRDTFALFTTLDSISRPTSAYIFDYGRNAFVALSSFVDARVGFAYQPIMSSGGLYLAASPQLLRPSMNGAQNMVVNVHSTYPNYEVVCHDDWIYFSVDKILDRILVDVGPADEDRIGEILFIAGDDTVRCIVYQSVAASIQKDVDLAISLFPNPSSDGVFYLESDGGEMQLDVFDMMGRNVWSHKTSSFYETIDLSRQRNGMYILRILKNGKQKTFKLIKE